MKLSFYFTSHSLNHRSTASWTGIQAALPFLPKRQEEWTIKRMKRTYLVVPFAASKRVIVPT